MNPIPVVLFAYSRPIHLIKTLSCLKENQIPLLYVFSDGPKDLEVAQRVESVRNIIHKINWCEVHIFERSENLGLGKSILTGVGEVLSTHNAAIIFEDDLVCVKGTYQYLSAALEHYKDEQQVMSVTGWTHPLVTPKYITDQPYFDGRGESWSWGTWARVWKKMDKDALKLIKECQNINIDIYKYGADLPRMAKIEKKKNLWAVRFLYLHIINKGLCLRPPHSMIDHIGFDSFGTNAKSASDLSHESLEVCPPWPKNWPAVVENEHCPALWQSYYGYKPRQFSAFARAKKILRNIQKCFF